MNELEAVKALRKGDKTALGYFFRRYYDRLVAYITTYSNDKTSSEDIVQQAFINLWEDRGKLDPERSPRHYLFSIARNRYMDSVKNEKRRLRLLDELWEEALQSRVDEDREELEKRIEHVKKILASLPPKCQEIIKLNKVEGVKYKDIAIRMDISIKTVEAQMRIAFQKIREAFRNDQLILTVLLRKLRRRKLPRCQHTRH
ncbi:RNA polymerase sigma factor [Sinomicrobium soli]|uniref:RNA polymerase sigma factor n=1 Tax=Sinomicrobium sp. N-1-3-6 TaxID=2219864 RepID=UPI000DCCF4C1|nr:RNA polymerase sigma-70 factor [Sinomicrobium sp. N-1-3-6]RAV30560.1 RNA polymerase sigma-70 factor [Sinomicrobium sp. N-1-3-6]